MLELRTSPCERESYMFRLQLKKYLCFFIVYWFCAFQSNFRMFIFMHCLVELSVICHRLLAHLAHNFLNVLLARIGGLKSTLVKTVTMRLNFEIVNGAFSLAFITYGSNALRQKSITLHKNWHQINQIENFPLLNNFRWKEWRKRAMNEKHRINKTKKREFYEKAMHEMNNKNKKIILSFKLTAVCALNNLNFLSVLLKSKAATHEHYS